MKIFVFFSKLFPNNSSPRTNTHPLRHQKMCVYLFAFPSPFPLSFVLFQLLSPRLPSSPHFQASILIIRLHTPPSLPPPTHGFLTKNVCVPPPFSASFCVLSTSLSRLPSSASKHHFLQHTHSRGSPTTCNKIQQQTLLTSSAITYHEGRP